MTDRWDRTDREYRRHVLGAVGELDFWAIAAGVLHRADRETHQPILVVEAVISAVELPASSPRRWVWSYHGELAEPEDQADAIAREGERPGQIDRTEYDSVNEAKAAADRYGAAVGWDFRDRRP